MATKEESQVNEAPEEVVAQQTEAADEVEVVEVEETAEGYEPDEKPEGVSVKVLTDMQRQIEELKREKTEQEDLALRTTAEMQNLRRRVERDVENAHKYARTSIV